MAYFPLVSIIISAYNAEKYIAQTLDSVLKQTWKNLEIIVVNDGSKDSTAEILENYIHTGIKIVYQENKGQDAALNNGYRHSSGEYIKFMDSDDLINPEMIQRQVEILNASTEHIAYSEWSRFFNDNTNSADFSPLPYWKDSEPLDFLTATPIGVMLQCAIILIPRELIEKAGLWDERLILFNDTEFFNRIIIHSKGIKFSKGARLYYRSGMLNSISAGRKRKFYESTYLATNLIAQQLLAIEDSPRIRKLISNTFFMQYYHMYPRYSDLINKHEESINYFGFGDMKPYGGPVYLFLEKIIGWKNAMTMQYYLYSLGYLKLKYKLFPKK